MNIEELIPEIVEWRPKLAIEGQPDKELVFVFRPFTIEDEAWLKRNYPDARLQEVFEKLDTKELARLAYHQLSPASKRELMSIKFIDVDDHGKDFEFAMTGPEKVGALVKGNGEVIELINMILKTRGLSLPLLEKLIEKVGIEGLQTLAHGKK